MGMYEDFNRKRALEDLPDFLQALRLEQVSISFDNHGWDNQLNLVCVSAQDTRNRIRVFRWNPSGIWFEKGEKGSWFPAQDPRIRLERKAS
jgi:hypothetical protein